MNTELKISDSEFIRGNVPMTKEEIRIVSLSKLGISNDSIVYDIGAGTGSIAVTAAYSCPSARVYAFEKNPEAVELIKQNRDKFGVNDNLYIIEGDALINLKESIPAPTHVFIGGSGGRLLEIVKLVREKNDKVRFVVNAITLETMNNCLALSEIYEEYADMEIIQMGISRGRKAGGLHMMFAENPIYIATFCPKNI
jgi:precorrin-6Y C5,15-methyltransferase (decarboxylating)